VPLGEAEANGEAPPPPPSAKKRGESAADQDLSDDYDDSDSAEGQFRANKFFNSLKSIFIRS
jgi:hypothetical protein